jgi:hypothetical protein
VTVPQVTRVKAALLLGTHRSIFEAACALGDDSTPESAVMRLLLDDDGDMDRYAQHVLDRLGTRIKHDQAVAASMSNHQALPAYSITAIQTLRRAAMSPP